MEAAPLPIPYPSRLFKHFPIFSIPKLEGASNFFQPSSPSSFPAPLGFSAFHLPAAKDEGGAGKADSKAYKAFSPPCSVVSIEELFEVEEKASAIIKEAEREAGEIVKEAEEEAEVIVEKAEKKAEEIRKEKLSKAKAEVEELRERELGEAKKEVERLSKISITPLVEKALKVLFEE